MKPAQAIARVSYAGLLLWQWVWHALLPMPTGNRNALLALILFLPLVIPVSGVLRGAPRRMLVAGYIVVFYLVGSVMQAWVSEPQRWPALVHVGLCTAYIIALAWANWPGRSKR